MKFTKANHLRGELQIPGDKSISHRAIMLGSLAKGTTEITNFLQGADCLSSMACFQSMGISITRNKDTVLVHGKGLHGLSKPEAMLDVGNSGTTTRLMSGILAAQPFESSLNGDASIQKRPMKRIMEPLSLMGAQIESLAGNGCAPLRIVGKPLKGIHYQSKVASAQVKSCILFAGLYADGETSVTEPYVSRNHSELMLSYFGGTIKTEGTTATVLPEPVLSGQKVSVPGDISSAAYFIAAALLVPGSEVLIKNVGTNPTRDGILRVCKQMGADITLLNTSSTKGEPSADLFVRSSSLHGTVIGGELIPALIDELPIIAILASYAEGETIIKDAQELKVKESNRIDVMVSNLSKMGVDIQATDDGMIIHGGKPLHGAVIDSKSDHRIAMSFAVASLQAEGVTEILGSECVRISYPGFYEDLKKLSQ
ncbi:3-phosphoshikimate 1-carboxyvinyltransferase [[Clostridium] polysaccharolyticum]|uniref:3-phosphoshikimate 1-carboxyvinyltransferase n=1 Tax=[Clostridium] polysaccharolyticum TaxID=29364 RepID=A0A1H9Y010_9FIRM|nr:3-phosphoshikimate 1-carboxyvinyltransferase [[Clostridium] polysaccharolyticum]SES62013.1 3-phosphoshikimate 1-carboxyvinyltransferase [[Clostridium] polysaccharolyticum]